MRASTDTAASTAAAADRAVDTVADWHEFRMLGGSLGARWPAVVTTAAQELTATLSGRDQDGRHPDQDRVLAAYHLRRSLEEQLLRDAAASNGSRPIAHALPRVAAATAAIYVDVVRGGRNRDLPGISRQVREALLGQLDMLARDAQRNDGAGGEAQRGDAALVVPGLLAALAADADQPLDGMAHLAAALDRTVPLLAPVELLLRAGGDDRQVLDPATLQDRYGLGLYPATTPLTFASCTASAPTPEGFEVAARCRAALVVAALEGDLAPRLDAAWASVRSELLRVLGVGADLGVEVVPTPSGTDAELVPLAMCLARGRPVTTIVVAPGEVGSGSASAAAGLAFAERRPNGRRGPVGESHVVAGRAPLVHRVEVRDQHGMPRSPTALGEELQRTIERSLGDGEQVLLHVVEGSKTEVRAPSARAVLAWKQRFGDRLDIVVDAAQARLAPGVVRAYLDAGASVIVTGSKFYGGPPFSGAVLLPRSAVPGGGAAALARTVGGIDLDDYLDRHALPPGRRRWGPERGVAPNLGLLLRWQIALHELRAYDELDDAVSARIVQDLASVVRRQLDAHPSLEAVASAASNAGRDHPTDSPIPPTIFAFRVRAGAAFLGLDALRSLHARLRAPTTTAAELHGRDGHVLPLSVELGQPVGLGPDGRGGAVLRLAISAYNVRRTALDPERGACLDRRIEREANDIRVALDRVERLARRFAPG